MFLFFRDSDSQFHLYFLFEVSFVQVLQLIVSNADAAACETEICLLKKQVTAGDMEHLEMTTLLVQLQPTQPPDTNAQFPIITMGDVSSLCGERRVDMGIRYIRQPLILTDI